ncbi:MAG TPA: hypothetical protein PK876_10285 [Elusimicrobiota bacterium]|nr:hypothetical protein [Elusimicrobiota bacterium]
MCGIFGIYSKSESDLTPEGFSDLLTSLFLFSESRGKEAAGMAISVGDRMDILKAPIPAHSLVKQKDYSDLLSRSVAERRSQNRSSSPLIAIGHSRLVTNGALEDNHNNQPLSRESLAVVHNGIIVNDEHLWETHEGLKRHLLVDTEVLIAILEDHLANGCAMQEATNRLYSEIEGSATIALIKRGGGLLLATNTGSLYHSQNTGESLTVFASEEYILSKAIRSLESCQGVTMAPPRQLIAWWGLSLHPSSALPEEFPLQLPNKNASHRISGKQHGHAFQTALSLNSSPDILIKSPIDVENIDPPRELTRCRMCVLPDTIPFIRFDEKGVCHYCRSYQKQTVLGKPALEEALQKLRLRGRKCLIAFSGGRDSSWGLHYVKTQLGLNPIAFSYDWGVITDIARRNQARMCGRLGVEHILVSADIQRKRDYVRRNIQTWLKRPHLGLVPIFMAGDKEYFYHLNRLRHQTGIQTSILCENRLERTDFKTGFCGIRIDVARQRIYNIALWKKIALGFFYARHFAMNPGYINPSLWDNFFGFISSYFVSHDHVFLYDYIRWDEEEIDKTLRDEYNWEISSDTSNTWRIGDGTAPFYNYIYYRVAGFTENDVLRSNQVREGVLSRDKALELVKIENRPRYESLREYLQMLRLDPGETLRAINNIPRLTDRPQWTV